MRFSVCVDPRRPWDDVRALVSQADQVGFDGAWLCDHFMRYAPGHGQVDGPILEGWTMLAALAGSTEHLRLGTLVLGNTYRHPAIVANMAATMDHIANGRFTLGLGAGCQVNEHFAYGIPLPPPAQRLDQFEEACHVIRSLLHDERTTMHGKWYELRNARCDPKPVQSRLPLLIGGGGERRTLRVVSLFADEWHTWSRPGEFRRKSAVLDRHCSTLGRDPATIRRLSGASVPEGSPGEVVDELEAYRAAGVDEFVVRDDDAVPVAQALETISSLAEDVAPHLR
jgi:F420-dependent oxidoreductase-like protein